MDINKIIASELGVNLWQVENAAKLVDEGNTIPFISRYRKEATGDLGDENLRKLEERLLYLRNLEERKEEVKRFIEDQGILTEVLASEIDKAEVLQRVEDLYKPYKQKKATRASKAKAKGLEPLAIRIYAQIDREGDVIKIAQDYVNEELEVNTPEEALAGACDIIAEVISEDADLLEELRDRTFNTALINTEAIDKEKKSVYEMYYDRQEAIKKIPNHRVLAINRGEREKKLKVKIVADDVRLLERIYRKVLDKKQSIYEEVLRETCQDSFKRLIFPSIEREMRNRLTEKAEEEAVKVFAQNTQKLLMTPPIKGKKVLSIDPGYRTGCKVAVLGVTGKLLAYTTIYPTKPKEDIAGAERVLKAAIDKYGVEIIVIGNGTASRETEEVVSNFIKKTGLDVQYTIVSEAGASIYSASKLASEEYPDLDVTTRGAMSLGRRLQDPLSELVKIEPKHIGVGQYQHDINQKNLNDALTKVVEDCVNKVGVDLNTASPSLLVYIAGINGTIAKNIVKYREENGAFKSRKELLNVSRLGEKAFTQCAGFLRISGGDEVLDSTSVHPESYKACKALMEKLGIGSENLAKGGNAKIDQILCEKYHVNKPSQAVKTLSKELEIGILTLTDIIEELKKPGRDPREEAPPVVFSREAKSIDDLKEGMELMGTVRNVVDFGAFVDIGVKEDGLVHISQLSHKFVSRPMDVVSIGDNVKVKILSIDRERGKIGLTMKL